MGAGRGGWGKCPAHGALAPNCCWKDEVRNEFAVVVVSSCSCSCSCSCSSSSSSSSFSRLEITVMVDWA